MKRILLTIAIVALLAGTVMAWAPGGGGPGPYVGSDYVTTCNVTMDIERYAMIECGGDIKVALASPDATGSGTVNLINNFAPLTVTASIAGTPVLVGSSYGVDLNSNGMAYDGALSTCNVAGIYPAPAGVDLTLDVEIKDVDMSVRASQPDAVVAVITVTLVDTGP